ncbi:hypothetical protein SRB17_49800 [Streptomyces sp. RB17]|nr:hypothetical protein [Streptomyces sp. RB17]
MLRDHCSLYNGTLQERRDAYRHVSRTTVRYGPRSAQLTAVRAFGPERKGRRSFSSQQATLRRLDKASAAFFRRIKAGEKPGYRRFRGVNRFDTVRFPKDGDGCRWDSIPRRQTLIRDPDRRAASPEPLPPTGSVVGSDLGIANFLADSNGGIVENPRHA